MSSLDGKVGLVTGAGRGIGRAVAIELAEAGVLVALLARSRIDLEETLRRVRETGGTGHVVEVDLTRRDRLSGVLRQVTSTLGDVQIVINNAGTAAPVGAAVSLDAMAWASALELNLVAPATLTFALLPAMLDHGWGRVVNLSSGVVDDPREMLRANAYLTSKTALEAHTINLAAELAHSGVTINVFRPGAVRTDMFDYLQGHPASVGTPELNEWAVRAWGEDELISPEVAAQSLAARLRTDANGQIWDVSDDL